MKTSEAVRPEWVRALDPDSEVFLDMGRYLRYGAEPLADVLDLLKELRPHQFLHLACPREPALLYRMFYPMGFDCYIEKNGETWDFYLRSMRDGKRGRP